MEKTLIDPGENISIEPPAEADAGPKIDGSAMESDETSQSGPGIAGLDDEEHGLDREPIIDGSSSLLSKSIFVVTSICFSMIFFMSLISAIEFRLKLEDTLLDNSRIKKNHERILTEMERRSVVHEAEISKKNQKISAISSEMNGLKEEHRKSQRNLISLKATVELQQNDLSEKERKISAINSEMNGLKEEKEKIQQNVASLKAKIEMQDSDLREKDQGLKQRDGQIQFQALKISDLDQKLKAKADIEKNLVRRHNQQLMPLKKKVVDQIWALRKKDFELSQSLKELQRVKEHNRRTVNLLKETRYDLEWTRSQMKQLKERATRSEQQLASKLGDVEETKARLAAMEQSHLKVEQDLRDAQMNLRIKDRELNRVYDEQHQSSFELVRTSANLTDARKRLEMLASLRQRIAGKIIQELNEHGIAGQINPNTGAFTLNIGESFYFRQGSYRLSKDAKKALQHVIKVYGKVLLSDHFRDKITSFKITGHASPEYGNKLVDFIHGEAAYRHNLKLSTQRANQVAQYLFSNEVGDFPHRNLLRAMTQTIGRGHMEPIPLELNSEEGRCGPFDCDLSRRVEIEFELVKNADVAEEEDILALPLAH